MTTKKYRPYFTLSELTILRDLCSGVANKHQALYKYLYGFVRDIEDGLRVPNHINQPTIAQKLELDDMPSSNTNPYTKIPSQLYAEWIGRNRSFIGFSPASIESINQYRYENDLMSAEEEKQYEASLFKSSP